MSDLTRVAFANVNDLVDVSPKSFEYYHPDVELLDVLESLQTYLNLRKDFGGHRSPEGKDLATKWSKYVQTVQREQ